MPKLRQGLGNAMRGTFGPSIAILNTEVLNSKEMVRAPPGSRNYKFVTEAYGETSGVKAIQNVVQMFHALSGAKQ